VRSDKRIVFNDLNGVEQVRVFEKGVTTSEEEPLNYGESRFEIRDGDIISPRIKPAEPLKNQCRHFLECVRLGSGQSAAAWRAGKSCGFSRPLIAPSNPKDNR